MKLQKITLASLSIALSTFLFAAPTFAQESTTVTYVAGKVTTNSNPAVGAAVHVVCNGHPFDTTTNGGGDYLAQYNPSDCANGNGVTVTASKNGQTASSNGTVNHWVATIDLAIVNIDLPVPEFGLITGGIAALTSAGAYWKMRKVRA